jgi:hypothetical protein
MLEQVAADASPSQAPCFVSTNSLRRMRKRAQTVVKENWLPRDVSMRTKGMALPVNGTVSTTRRGQKGSAAAAARVFKLPHPLVDPAPLQGPESLTAPTP